MPENPAVASLQRSLGSLIMGGITAACNWRTVAPRPCRANKQACAINGNPAH